MGTLFLFKGQGIGRATLENIYLQEDNRQLRQSKGSILIETALFGAAFIDNEVFN